MRRLYVLCGVLLLAAAWASVGTITFDYNQQSGVTSIAVSDPSRMLVYSNSAGSSAVNVFGPTFGSAELLFSKELYGWGATYFSSGGVFVMAWDKEEKINGQSDVMFNFLAIPGTCEMAYPHWCNDAWGGDLSQQVEWFNGSDKPVVDTVFLHVELSNTGPSEV